MDFTVTNQVDKTVVVQPGMAANVVMCQPGMDVAVEQCPMVVANISQPSIGVLVVGGPPGPPGPPGSGALNLTGQYPIFYDAGSGVIGIVSGYYVTFPDLTSASGAIVAQITAASAGVSALNGLSGFVSLAAVSPLFISANGQTLTISGSGLATLGDLNALSGYFNSLVSGLNTGTVNLSGYITTGQADQRYYPLASNPSGYITSGQTGQFYPASNPQHYSTSGDLSNTGSYLYSLITGNTGTANLSGYLTTGQADLRYYPLASNPSGYITTGQTGQFYPASNPQHYATSGDLTGASGFLYSLITGNTGHVTAFSTGVTSLNGATGDLSLSGLNGTTVFRSGSIIFVSGQTLTGDFATNASLAATGSYLYQTTTGASGYLLSLINASSAGVAAINGQSGLITIQGAGSVSVFTNGQVITVSGSASTGVQPPFTNSLTFVSPIPTGNDNYFVSFPSTFLNIPIVGITLETLLTPVYYGMAVSGRTLTGFSALFSEAVLETGLYLNVIAQEPSILSFLVNLPTGTDTYFVTYPTAFTYTPVINLTLETAQFASTYGVAISGKSPAGFYALFTETILQTGFSLNVLAR